MAIPCQAIPRKIIQLTYDSIFFRAIKKSLASLLIHAAMQTTILTCNSLQFSMDSSAGEWLFLWPRVKTLELTCKSAATQWEQSAWCIY